MDGEIERFQCPPSLLSFHNGYAENIILFTMVMQKTLFFSLALTRKTSSSSKIQRELQAGAKFSK